MKNGLSSWLIVCVSVLIPAVVFALFFLVPNQVHTQMDLKILPSINASLNFSTFCLLLLGRYFIKHNQQTFHKRTMILSVVLSGLFLISYVVYHSLSEPTAFGGVGWIRPLYFFILISHIILAAVIVPFILITLSRGLQKRFDKHKRIAKIAWPLWVYVSATGVLVYLMLSPYYL